MIRRYKMIKITQSERNKLWQIVEDGSLKRFKYCVAFQGGLLDIYPFSPFDMCFIRFQIEGIEIGSSGGRTHFISDLAESKVDAKKILKSKGLKHLRSQGASGWLGIVKVFKKYNIALPEHYKKVFGGEVNE